MKTRLAQNPIRHAMKKRFANGTKIPREYLDATQEYAWTATIITKKTTVQRI
jgi:hypothetical protein